jgi:hypothetical protein
MKAKAEQMISSNPSVVKKDNRTNESISETHDLLPK